MTYTKRRRVIAGNWKMHKTLAETRAYFANLKSILKEENGCDIVVAPAFTAIATAVESVGSAKIAIAAQNLYWEKEGPFTGEVSAGMLIEAGCRYVIVGHSERRQYFGEVDATVFKKTKAALAVSLTPIVCIGELLQEHENGKTAEVCRNQFMGSVGALTPDEFSRILIAYEPVWAIGTGRVATPEIAAAAHRVIRNSAAQIFSTELANQLRILYGGSVKPDNIKGLMEQEELDGALVGGASLDASSFAAIIAGSA